MNNFNIQNFVLLSQALKDLPKKQKSSYSMIGAMGSGGLGGILPAFALGKAEIAKNRATEAEAKVKELTDKAEADDEKAEAAVKMLAETIEALGEKAQELYTQIGGVFAESRAETTKAAVIEATRDSVDALGLKVVKDADGSVVLPGATVLQPDLPLSDITAGELSNIAEGVATVFAAALTKAAEPNTDPDD